MAKTAITTGRTPKFGQIHFKPVSSTMAGAFVRDELTCVRSPRRAGLRSPGKAQACFLPTDGHFGNVTVRTFSKAVSHGTSRPKRLHGRRRLKRAHRQGSLPSFTAWNKREISTILPLLNVHNIKLPPLIAAQSEGLAKPKQAAAGATPTPRAY